MKQALEALEEIHVGNMTPMSETNWNKAITSLRQAIAQAQEKEPCTRVECMGNSGCIGYCWNKKKQKPVGEVVLYTGDGFPCAPFLQVKWANGQMPAEGTQLFTEEQP